MLNRDARSLVRQTRWDQPRTGHGRLVQRKGPTWYGITKILVDFLVALVLLLLTAPLLLLAALAIKLTSRGPIVYSQTRVGRGGLPYTIYKLRTMYHNCELHSGACWATAARANTKKRATLSAILFILNFLLCERTRGPRLNGP